MRWPGVLRPGVLGASVLRPGLPGLLGPGAALWLEPVAAAEAVPHDGGVEAVAQGGQVALEGGAGDFQAFEHGGNRHRVRLAQQLLDFVEAFYLVHGLARFCYG